MKRSAYFLVILWAAAWMTLTAPAWAQDTPTGVDPAANVPASTPIYLELDTSAAGLQAFTTAANDWLGMIGVPFRAPDSTTALDLVVANRLPAISSVDILSWVGSRATLVLNEGATPGITDFAFVLPIADPAGAQAFVDTLKARTFDHGSYGDVTLYYAGTYTIAASPTVVWVGSPAGVDAIFRAAPGALAASPAYQRVRGQLPAAPITMYANGAWLQSSLAALGAEGQLPFAAIPETFLRLLPVESGFKTALLDGVALDGLGVAIQADDQQVSAELVVALGAQFDTPAAPLTMGAYAPADSFLVLDSYDVTALAGMAAGAVGLLLPSPGTPFTFEATPVPTPTPLPSPVQTLMAQWQPILVQAELMAGLSLDDLYALIDGEYLIAAFPADNGATGAALWIKSSDPARLIDAVERASKLVLTDPNGTQLVNVERTTVSGVPVAYVSVPGTSERLALGAANDALFVTLESLVQQVIDAPAQSNDRAWLSAFGSQQNAALYVDPRALDAAVLQQQRDPALPLAQIDGGLNISGDGIFSLHITGIRGN